MAREMVKFEIMSYSFMFLIFCYYTDVDRKLLRAVIGVTTYALLNFLVASIGSYKKEKQLM